MTKYSAEDRIRAVRMVEEEISKAEVVRRLGAKSKVIRCWWYAYEAGGTEQLVYTVKHKEYTAAFKIHAVEFLRQNGLSYDQASADLGIPSSQTHWRWERQYLESGPENLEVYFARGKSPGNYLLPHEENI